MSTSKQRPVNPRRTPEDVRQLARTHTKRMIGVLVAIAEDVDQEDVRARVAAAIAVLDRGWSKPGNGNGANADPDRNELRITLRQIVDHRSKLYQQKVIDHERASEIPMNGGGDRGSD